MKVPPPGHMYVGFYLDPGHHQIGFLETTMLGRADLRGAGDPSGLGRFFGAYPSWASFTQAWQYAAAAYQQHLADFQGGSAEYQLIDLQRARQIGILPIAFAP